MGNQKNVTISISVKSMVFDRHYPTKGNLRLVRYMFSPPLSLFGKNDVLYGYEMY